jgi:hypothetical protein
MFTSRDERTTMTKFVRDLDGSAGECDAAVPHPPATGAIDSREGF